MKIIGVLLLSLTTFLWAEQVQVNYKETVASPKQSAVAMEVLAEGMKALESDGANFKGAVKIKSTEDKLVITVDRKKLKSMNAMVWRISNSTTGRQRKEQTDKYVEYKKYVNKVAKAQHFIKGNRKKLEDTKAQVCVEMGLENHDALDIEASDLISYRWDNEISGVDMYQSTHYVGDIHLAAEILRKNVEVIEDDEYFYVQNIRVENGKLLADGVYIDYEEDNETFEITKGPACETKIPDYE